MRNSEAYRVPKIVMDSKERDYQLAKKAALSQGNGNPYIAGIQTPGDAVKESRTEYGAPTVMPQTVGQGDNGFEQKDSPANVVSVNPVNTSGSTAMGTSATANANEEPNAFQADGLARRMEAYSKAMGNSELNLNDLSQTSRLS